MCSGHCTMANFQKSTCISAPPALFSSTIPTPFPCRINLRVIPRAGRNELKQEEGRWRLYLKAVPEQGKANEELVRFFKKELGVHARIITGFKSRQKVVEIRK